MNHHATFRTKTKIAALVLAVGVALSGVTLAALHGLAVEGAQARSLVISGQSGAAHGDVAGARLAFERARLLAPRADFVRSALASLHAPDSSTPLARYVSFIAPREWSALLVACAWVTGLGLALMIARKQRPLAAARRVTLLSAFLLVLSTGGFVLSSKSAKALAVVERSTGLLVAPYDSAGATADLGPGVVVGIDARYGDYMRVRGPNGEHGWVAEHALVSVTGT